MQIAALWATCQQTGYGRCQPGDQPHPHQPPGDLLVRVLTKIRMFLAPAEVGRTHYFASPILYSVRYTIYTSIVYRVHNINYISITFSHRVIDYDSKHFGQNFGKNWPMYVLVLVIGTELNDSSD